MSKLENEILEDLNERDLTQIVAKVKEIRDPYGRFKIFNGQYRVGCEKYKDLLELATATINANKEADLIQEKMFKRGWDASQATMVAVDLVDFVKTVFRYDLHEVYKFDKKFIDTANKVIELLKANKVAEVEKYRNLYYIIIGGNTRFSILFTKKFKDEKKTEKINAIISVISLDEKYYSKNIRNDFSKKYFERSSYEYSLELLFDTMEDNIHSKNIVEENKIKAFRVIADFFNEYSKVCFNSDEGLICNLKKVEDQGFNAVGGDVISDVMKSCIEIAISDAMKTKDSKTSFKNISDYEDKKDIKGAVKDASYILAKLIGYKVNENNVNRTFNMLAYSGLDKNLYVVNKKRLLGYLDFICHIKNSSRLSIPQGTIMKEIIEVPESFDLKKKASKEDFAIFEDRSLSNISSVPEGCELCEDSITRLRGILKDVEDYYGRSSKQAKDLKKLFKIGGVE